MFTCVIEIQNTNTTVNDVKWKRTRTDQNRIITISPHNPSHTIVNTISEHTLTSVIMITGLSSAHMGPYWLEIGEDGNRTLSDVVYLSIALNGMFVCYISSCSYVRSYVTAMCDK